MCAASGRSDDEAAMAWTFMRNPESAYGRLDQRYIGRELGTDNQIDGIVVWHDSAHHAEVRRSSLSMAVRQALKRCEIRLFRTGRTRAAQQRSGLL
jgi:hypothetical protein